METTIDQSKEFSNELVHCTATAKPDCIVELSVKALGGLIKKARESSVKSISKAVTVPGFRRGKAPESLITENFAKEIEKATKENLAKEAYLQCKTLIPYRNLDPKDSFSYQVQSFSNDEGSLILSFETTPSVPEVNVTAFSLKPVNRPIVDTAKVDETVRQALFFYAKWDTVTGRAVQEGDFILLDAVVVEENGKTSPLFKGTRFEVTDKSMARWMKDAVLGKNVDEEVEATSVADEDATEEEKALFKPRQVKLTIKAIESAILPELTEDLLQKLKVTSEADLKEKIEKQLNEQADEHVANEQREQALTFLIDNHPFDLPKTLVRKELEFRTRQLSQDPGFMEHWNSLGEDEKRKMITFLTSQTEKSVRLSFLCSSLLKKADIPFPGKTESKAIGEYSHKMLMAATDYIIAQGSQQTASC